MLNTLAKADEMSFLSAFETKTSRILWLEGEEVAYYTYSAHSIYPVPMLHQIFVRREFRRRGYCLQLANDFLERFKVR